MEALRRGPLPFVPDGSLTEAIARAGADWNWGQTTVARLGEITVDVLKRAIWLAPLGSEARKQIRDCREGVHGTLAGIRTDRRELDAYWARAAQLDNPRMPARGRAISQPASGDNLAALDRWIAEVVQGWEGPTPGTRRERLYRQSLTLAAQLLASADALAEVAAAPNPTVDPDGVEAPRLRALVAYLLEGAASSEAVLHRMLMLDVVQLAFAGAAEDAEQLMRILLSPERLRQLGHDADSAFDRIWEIALGPEDSPGPPGARIAVERRRGELQGRAAGGPRIQAVGGAAHLRQAVGTQRITQDVGTDTFARTASHAAAVLANAVGAVNKPRLVATVLGALRGYALIVWAMIQFGTMPGRFAANAVSLAVAAGAVLLAVTMVVPGIPVGLTILGVLLVLAGATASALRVRRARNVGTRLVAASVLALGALGALLWYDWSHDRSGSVVWGVLIKLGVALGVVLLGWWVAQARGHRPGRTSGP